MCLRQCPDLCLDSLAQSCGLSLPTIITERIGIMPRIPCCTASRAAGREAHVSFLAGSASEHPGRQQTRIDFPTRLCGLCLPMLFERISTVAVPVKMTPIHIASGPAERLDNRIAVRGAKSFSRPVARSPCRRGSMMARAGPVY
jgi:hypothetical protein